MKTIKLSALITTIFLMGSSIVQAKENLFAGVAQVSQKMADTALGMTPEQNTLVCPLGPTQILQTFHQLLRDNQLQIEIENFGGHALVAKDIIDFQHLLQAHKLPNSDKDDPVLSINNYIAFNDQNTEVNIMNGLDALGSKILPMDFSNPLQSINTINALVAQDTDHKITELLSKDSINTDTNTVFLSTLYVKTKWRYLSEKAYLKFNKGKDSHMVMGFKSYAKSYFKNDDLIVIIPAKGDLNLMIKMTMNGALSSITPEDFVVTNSKNVALTMPAFTIESTLDLKTMFMQYLPKVLTEKFMHLLSKELSHISEFRQKNKIEVNEKGLEGSSATAFGAANESTIKPEFDEVIVNKPFSYLLFKSEDGKDNNLWLLTGTVTEPIPATELSPKALSAIEEAQTLIKSQTISNLEEQGIDYGFGAHRSVGIIRNGMKRQWPSGHIKPNVIATTSPVARHDAVVNGKAVIDFGNNMDSEIKSFKIIGRESYDEDRGVALLVIEECPLEPLKIRKSWSPEI